METKVMRLLKTINAVEEVYLVYGAYDIVAKIRTESMDELKEITTSRLRKSNEIRSSTTMIVIPEKLNLVVLTGEGPKITS